MLNKVKVKFMQERIKRPLIGVLVNDKYFLYHTGTQFAAKLMQANEIAQCTVCFFSLPDIDWRNKEIVGTMFSRDDSRLTRHLLPFPDIIYDRCVYLLSDQNTKLEEIRRRFKTLSDIQFINSGKLEKWPVYQRLSLCREARDYLPDTVLFRHFDDLKNMLFNYDQIFIKTSPGSGGRGVISVERLRQCYQLSFYRHGAHRTLTASSLNDIKVYLSGMMGAKPEKMIIQQGIRLIKHDGRLLDLRILLVKNKFSQWIPIYNQARIAQKGAVITNLSLGGDVADYRDLSLALEAQYPDLPSDTQLREICVLLAKCIESRLGPFGEIGMDMAVDESGKIWLLEGNSKPSKLPEKMIEDTVGVSPQFLMILEYAGSLYQFSLRSRQLA
jgi:glutathione synthase/RimK-type ligase-like ATP-grasp enzyme